MRRHRNKISVISLALFRYGRIVLCLYLFCSCSATKFLEDGERLYTGAKLKFTKHGKVGSLKQTETQLEDLITPKPNFSIFGMRPGVWIHYKTQTPKEKGLKHWLNEKLGEEPVLMEDVRHQQVANVLEGNLFNDGFFEAEVSSDVQMHKKTASVDYLVEIYPPFKIRNVEYPDDSIFQNRKDDLLENTLLEEGQRFKLQDLSGEKSRIEAYLENDGFYYFDDQYLIFEADSTVGNYDVDLVLTYASGVPDRAKRKYRFGKVKVINDYTLMRDTTRAEVLQPRDTITVDNYTYIDRRDHFEPELLVEYVNIRSGELYSRDAHDFTISHLMGLGTFKFVNIKYDDPDSTMIDATIYLTPRLKKSIRLEVDGVTKSNNFIGPRIGATFTNRNFLKGGEEFQLKLNGSYEVQVNRQQPGSLTAIEVGAEASLFFPRMVSPIRIYHYSTKYVPRTVIRLGTTFQRRINYFQLNSFNTAFGYTWRETTTRNHELFPIEVSYVQVSNRSVEFNDLLERNPVLANSFQDQFIPGMRYSFTYNSQFEDPSALPYETDDVLSTDFYFNGNVSLAGNLLNLVQQGVTSAEDGESFTMFGQPYSQFVLGDVDFRFYYPLNRSSKLATRLAIGAGYAYGNSEYLPYIKQFAVGGPNSIRAFQARTVGPGTYDYRTDEELAETSFIDQRGDVKLEGNIEYRFDIVGFLKGGIFVDAGNIWLWKEDEQRPGGQFNLDTFYKEIAVGTGFGLRLDFNFFILRFDLGLPLRKPTLPEGDRWVFDEINLSSKEWRKENLVLNIAIGYPF